MVKIIVYEIIFKVILRLSDTPRLLRFCAEFGVFDLRKTQFGVFDLRKTQSKKIIRKLYFIIKCIHYFRKITIQFKNDFKLKIKIFR